MVEDNKFTPLEGVYNQASLLMLRLNDLFKAIDIASMRPLMYRGDIGEYNYNIIARGLESIYNALQGKFTDKEKTMMENKIEAIQEFILLSPPCKKTIDYLSRVRNGTYINSWRELNKLLKDFRRNIEELMEKYKLGNPSKRDPTTSIVD